MSSGRLPSVVVEMNSFYRFDLYPVINKLVEVKSDNFILISLKDKVIIKISAR